MKKAIFIFIVLAFTGANLKAQNCNNIGFENGTRSNWGFAQGDITYNSLPCIICATVVGAVATIVTNTSSIGTQCTNGIDNYGGFPVVYPDGGSYSLKLSNDSASNKMEQASYAISVTPQNANLEYHFAAVLQRGSLPTHSAPYFAIEVYNLSGYQISCANYMTDSTTVVGWQVSPVDNSVYYTTWQTVHLNLLPYIGQTIRIDFNVSDGNDYYVNSFGYVYLDASCNVGVITNSSSLCHGGLPVTLYGPTGMTSYNWSGPVTGSLDSLVTSTPGDYTLTTTSQSSCPSPILSYSLILNQAPTINYSLAQDTAPHTWDVYPTYTGGTPPYTYSWNWGDGTSIDTSAYPSHTYAVAGTYSICATITDANGCTDTACQNEAVYRAAYNNTLSNMVYVNVLNSNHATAINQLTGTNEELLVYPNPAQNNLQVAVNNVQIKELSFYDVLGNVVITQTIQATPNPSKERNGMTIDVSSLQKGVYFIQLKTADKTYITKFIKE